MYQANKISILGCGWLGLPLASRFIREGYQVKGSTTSPAKLPLLAAKGITPSLINLQDADALQALTPFVEADALIVSFPPGLRSGGGEAYLQQIRTLAAALLQVPTRHILFISSTSVYPDLNRVVTEGDDSLIDPRNVLRQAERLLADLPGKALTTVRLAGLAGGDRHPGRFLAGKTNVANPLAPVNLIHQDDCVEILFQIVRQGQWQQVFNACSEEHPSREAYYTAAALSLGLTPPRFAPPAPSDSFKIIANKKIKQALHYVFQFPDPRHFF